MNEIHIILLIALTKARTSNKMVKVTLIFFGTFKTAVTCLVWVTAEENAGVRFTVAPLQM